MPFGRRLLLLALLPLGMTGAASANGLGEGRPYQFRSEAQRQVFLTGERLRFELLGILGDGTNVRGGQGGQTGNAVSIDVSGSNNVINVTQTNSGSQNIQDGEDQWSCVGALSC